MIITITTVEKITLEVSNNIKEISRVKAYFAFMHRYGI